MKCEFPCAGKRARTVQTESRREFKGGCAEGRWRYRANIAARALPWVCSALIATPSHCYIVLVL